MTPCDDTGIERSSILSRTVTILLFLLAQVVAALLIGSVALAVSPTHAAEAQAAAFIKSIPKAMGISSCSRPAGPLAR